MVYGRPRHIVGVGEREWGGGGKKEDKRRERIESTHIRKVLCLFATVAEKACEVGLAT